MNGKTTNNNLKKSSTSNSLDNDSKSKYSSDSNNSSKRKQSEELINSNDINNINGTCTFKNKLKKDSTKNMSYTDKKDGAMNLRIRVVIPNYLVKYISENDQLIKKIEETYKTKCSFSDGPEVNVTTCEGIKGALVNFTGTLDNVMKSMQDIFLEIMLLENQINGKRYV